MKKAEDSIIKECIKNNIKNLDAVFVFPTQICASMWADKTLEFSGVTSVALERFIAWDQFKGSAIRSQHQDKNSVPSTMRSIFAENIVLENSNNPFLKSIITKEYAKSASRFTDWIAQILPSLSMWKNSFEKKGCSPDDEDQDFLELYNRYKNFLDQNNLFDPAWETPPFNPDGKKYFILFPEILMDYGEYKTILESSSDITLVHIPEEFKSVEPDGHFFTNTRIELKNVVHYLWNVHNQKNVSWNKIAISVPDMDSYCPYLERELDLYEIPHVQRNGRPLSSSGAGILFSQIQACHAENFSFESIKALILNRELPWKEAKLNDQLIEFGRENNCLCSYEYNGKQIDVWEESFRHPKSSDYSEALSALYKELKRLVTKIAESKTFSDIRTNYFLFREKFFDFTIENFPPENDMILSRCISELGALIDLEEHFKDNPVFNIRSCFNFFCSFLDGKMYVPQNASNGVQILPYRTAACAPFDVHVVVDASQSGISVVYKQLQFLRDDKRKQLGFIEDSNITQSFILLYEMNSQVDTLFTSAGKTIDAYAFTNSYLLEKDHTPGKEFEKQDFIVKDSYQGERDSFLFADTKYFPDSVYKNEKQGFENWIEASEQNREKEQSIPEKKGTEIFKDTVKASVILDGAVRVSPSSLKKFFSCPRSYMLERLLNVSPSDNAATLVDQYAMGNLSHKIMELYCNSLKDNGLALTLDSENNCLPDSYAKLLTSAVDTAIATCNYSHLSQQLFISTKDAILREMFAAVESFSKKYSDYKIFEVEKQYEFKPEGKDCYYYVRIDCMLSSPNGELVLVDFKNTKNAIPSNILWDGTEENIPDFQLPVYKYIIENMPDNPKTISACVFYGIKECELNVPYADLDGTPVKEDKNAKFIRTQERCLELVDVFVQKVKEYDLSPDFSNVDFSSCGGCTYKSICRKTFTVSPARD